GSGAGRAPASCRGSRCGCCVADSRPRLPPSRRRAHHGPMPLRCGTHSGSFHADDVLALALIRAFADPDATVVRTRDPAVLAACDVVFDVGGVHDPARGRFDHHQNDYTGDRSSAGLVLDWLEAEDKLPRQLASRLRWEV